MAAMPGSMYMSVVEVGGAWVGVGVGGAGSTAKAVTACEGQYDSEPVKLAYAVYLPSMSGVHW